MGDRALIVFTNNEKTEFSPVVYVHWHGYKVADWIKETGKLMESRGEDLSYATARFIGICHTHIEGNLSLGVWDGGAEVAANPTDASHGDHGVFIVNAKDFTFEQFGAFESCKVKEATT